jgi:hypothetical protein
LKCSWRARYLRVQCQHFAGSHADGYQHNCFLSHTGHWASLVRVTETCCSVRCSHAISGDSVCRAQRSLVPRERKKAELPMTTPASTSPSPPEPTTCCAREQLLVPLTPRYGRELIKSRRSCFIQEWHDLMSCHELSLARCRTPLSMLAWPRQTCGRRDLSFLRPSAQCLHHCQTTPW